MSQHNSEPEKAIKSEVIGFQPDCPFCWYRLSGTLKQLLAVGEISEFDNLLIGAGGIVTSATLSTTDKQYLETTVYEDVLSETFFFDMREWMIGKSFAENYIDVDDKTGEEALFVCSALDIAEHMTSLRRASEMLAA